MEAELHNCRTAVGINAVDRTDLLRHPLHVAERIDRAVVDVRNHKSLFNAGAGQNSVGLDADNLDTAPDVELAAQFGSRIGKLPSEGPSTTSTSSLVINSVFPALLRKVTSNCFTSPSLFYRQFHLIVGSAFGDLLLKRRGVINFQPVNLEDHVSLADSGLRSRTALNDAGHIDTARSGDAQLLALRIEEILDRRRGTERPASHAVRRRTPSDRPPPCGRSTPEWRTNNPHSCPSAT